MSNESTTLLEQKHLLMVQKLAKPGEDILKSLTPEKCDLLHMAVGVSGEAGELLDAVKKHVVYNKPLDVQNVVEELGDIEFYMAKLRSALFLTRREILQFNMDKLGKRYEKGYTDQAAQVRADKPAGQ